MATHWLRSVFVIMLVTFFVGGCTTTGPESEPTQPAPEPVETADTLPAPVAPPAAPPQADEYKNPYVPGTRRLLTRTFHFEYDRAVLNPDDLRALDMIATYLRNNRNVSVVLEGHCDERGTREYNLALGERRSDALRGYLTSAGVSARQMETVSYGEERPDDSGHSESAWARNRRAVIIYH